ncbi:hypothetical protein GGI12_002871 [Dipsacomyces acuminosporus]|nr:hypothetical protein GGI12_002871 [Dipsacomyces acuminosporus]
MATIFSSNGSDEIIAIKLKALQHSGENRRGAQLDDVEATDTSDDDEQFNTLAGSVDIQAHSSAFKPKSVKKAIASHISSANGAAAMASRDVVRGGVRSFTRVVKTIKHDSVMGEGLVASEELQQAACTGRMTESGSESSIVSDIDSLRKSIRDKSNYRDAVEPRDVLLREESPAPRRLASYKPPLMVIDPSFVPPQLASLNVDSNVWECFVDALNAAIPRGSQEIQNQIDRWNADAFDDLGFHIKLVSLDSGREKMTSAEEKELRAGLFEATQRGYSVLAQGGSALDAVEAAVRSLEDNPLFNAGKGAVFNIKGFNQLEASIMDGKTQAAGAATLLTVVKNPITLARRVMENTRHVFLGAEGAEELAREQGLDIVDPSYFWTRHRWEQHERGFLTASPADSDQASQTTIQVSEQFNDPSDYEHLPMGTVGAVAIDAHGNLATATSTGGATNKLVGRIGDTPIIGAGTWADGNVAVSGTGTGEFFIRKSTAQQIASRIGLLKESTDRASEVAIREMKALGGDGGVICIDSSGRFSMTFCSEGMYRGYCSEATGHVPVVGIFDDEVIAPGDRHLK